MRTRWDNGIWVVSRLVPRHAYEPYQSIVTLFHASDIFVAQLLTSSPEPIHAKTLVEFGTLVWMLLILVVL